MAYAESNEHFEHHITLSPFDCIAPLNYVRLIFPLPLKPEASEQVVFSELHEALHKTFAQEPWASGKVFRQSPKSPGWRPGQLEIRHDSYPLSAAWPLQLHHKTLETSWTYSELMKQNFPGDAFPEESLLDAPILGDVDGAGADVFLTQANFLPGGLLLGMTACHAATDGAGMFSLTKLWGENFRELHARDAGGVLAPSPFGAGSRDRTAFERSWKKLNDGRGYSHADERDHGSDRSDHSWLRGLVCLELDANPVLKSQTVQNIPNGNDSNHQTPLHKQTRTMLNRVMVLPNTGLAALRKDCAYSTPPPLPALSTIDAIQALLSHGGA